MPAATRLLVAFVLLIGAFVVLVGVAVGSLVLAGQHGLAAVVATAGLAGVAAGAFTWWLLRRDMIEGDDDLELAPLLYDEPPAVQPPVHRVPLRVHSMPVASLPPAYVDAVLRGAQARLSAMKAQGPQGAESR